jgi:carbamoyl-phosphate synthase large subunit
VPQGIRILFLGAGKRLSLLECFQAAARAEGLALEVWSVERSAKVPIAVLAKVLVGPQFEDEEFESYLLAAVERLQLDLVIPNMDSAAVALSRLKAKISALGAQAVVSDHRLCLTMCDKSAAAAWFAARGLPIPEGNGFPRIAKRRFGFGSRGQFVANDEDELGIFLSRRRKEDYVLQPFIPGQEYTVDAYVDRAGRAVCILSRKRLEVSAGEVQVSETHHHPGIIALTQTILDVRGWEGPITLQFIDGPERVVALEINPRFGGGVTHSIHVGLDMPRWLICEHLGRPLPPVPDWPDGSIMTRCGRDIFHDSPH